MMHEPFDRLNAACEFLLRDMIRSYLEVSTIYSDRNSDHCDHLRAACKLLSSLRMQSERRNYHCDHTKAACEFFS